MTYDFVVRAMRNDEFMQQIQEAMKVDDDVCLCTEIHRLQFNGSKKKVIVQSFSKESPFQHKIVPVEISYDTLSKMLDGDWDSIPKEEIRYL